MRKVIWILCFGLLFSNTRANALNNVFVLSGNIKTEKPIEVSLKTLFGKLMGKVNIDSKSGDFEIKIEGWAPDLYQITIGETIEKVFLVNNTVMIKGYYDAVDNKNTALNFIGIEQHLKLAAFIPEKIPDQRNVNPNTFIGLNSLELCALAGLFNSQKYDFNIAILQKAAIDNSASSEAERWLLKQVDSLKQYSVGVPAADFLLPDDKGKLTSLKDLKGKITVLDFWASWCGPCRKAMQEFKTFYDDFKDQVQFVSISLDDDPVKYQKGLNDMQIPWMKLLDNKGFYKSELNAKYGFNMIPYCVILNKDGIVLKRDIQSAASLKKALEELINTGIN